jgi:hypothetical protein
MIQVYFFLIISSYIQNPVSHARIEIKTPSLVKDPPKAGIQGAEIQRLPD